MIRLVERNRDHVVHLIAEGKVRGEDYPPMLEALEEAQRTQERVSFLIEMRDWKGFSLDGLAAELREDALDPLFKMEIRHFTTEGEMDAWEWLRGPIR